METSISPVDLEQCSHEMLDAIVGVLDERAKAQEKARKKQEREARRPAARR